MRIVRFKGESSIEAIADVAYADLSASSRKKVVTELVRANPQLESIDRLRPGTILHIPEIPGVRTTPSGGSDNPSDEIRDDLIEALQEYGKKLGEQQGKLETQLKEQEALLKDRTLSSALAESESATRLKKAAAESIADELKSVAEARKRFEAALEQLTADLKAW